MSLTKTTLQDTKDVDPFEWYKSARQQGPLVYDEDLGSWLATSYDAVREMFRLDNTNFRRKDAEAGSEYDEISGGRRNVKILTGEQHAKLHRWMMSSFTPAKTSTLQESIVREVVESLLAKIADRPSVELTTEFFNLIPIRVIAAVLDLPYQDDEWIDQANDKVVRIFNFYSNRGYAGTDVVADARQAHIEMRELMDPVLVARSSGEGDDLISQFFRVGPDILDDWNIEDVYINVMSFFLGGAHTSTLALANTFYVLLKDDDLMQRIREADDATLRAFVEQVLRIYPPQHYQQRRCIADVEIDGVQLKEGDLIMLLLASANRDETHYRSPDAIDLEQKNPRDHTTFFAGPHSCVGQGLARVEVVETVRQLLSRVTDMRLDPSAEEPRYLGLTMRGWGPLHVQLTVRS
jgi:cytochrome P450